MNYFWRPVLEEAEHFVLVVALALFEEAGVLCVDDIAALVEHNEYGKAEASRIAEAFHHLRRPCLAFGIGGTVGGVVYVDIDKVVADERADVVVLCDEVGKAQAPRAPVAAHLTDHELPFALGLFQRVVNLLILVDGLIVDFGEGRLGRCRSEDE